MTQQTVSKPPAALLFGAPGVGKGTQGRALGAIPGFYHLPSGEMFRNLAPDSDEGREASSYCSRGALVPDELTIRIFQRVLDEQIDTGQYQPNAELLLLDGIPRTIQQAKCLDNFVDVLSVVSFGYSDENTMVERIKSRAHQENRQDDVDEKTIRHRFEVYRTETEPVLDCFSPEVICTVDALRYPGEVLFDVLGCLNSIWPPRPTP